jgi:hypothetical protein
MFAAGFACCEDLAIKGKGVFPQAAQHLSCAPQFLFVEFDRAARNGIAKQLGYEHPLGVHRVGLAIVLPGPIAVRLVSLCGLLQFIAARGGLKPTGDLRHTLDRNPVVSGGGRLFRANGMTEENAMTAAVEAGYLDTEQGIGGVAISVISTTRFMRRHTGASAIRSVRRGAPRPLIPTKSVATLSRRLPVTLMR